jgi:hypothetical protein
LDWRAAVLIARAAWLEALRRRDPYVVLILGLALGGVAVVVGVVGIENASTAAFVLNFGMTFAAAAAHVLALLAAARPFPSEMESRAIYPVLARPVGRGAFLLGKWLGSFSIGVAGLAILLSAASISFLWTFPSGLVLLAQTVGLLAASVGLMAALALGLSIVLPKGVNVVALGTFYFLGAKAVEIARAESMGAGRRAAVEWATAYVPDFSKLNLVTRWTDGVAALTALEFVGLVAYAAIFTAAALAAAAWILERRTL